MRRFFRVCFAIIFIITLLLIITGCDDNDIKPPKPNDNDKEPKPDTPIIVDDDKPDPEKNKFLNIGYGEHERQTLDILLPDKLGKPNVAPYYVFIFIHRSEDWNAGDKEEMHFFAEEVLNSGMGLIAAICMNYRLLDDGATYHDMLDDINSVIKFVKDNGSQYNLGTKKVALLGDTEGGHLALLYSYKNTSPIPIGIVVSKSGIANLTEPLLYAQNEYVDTDKRLAAVSRLTGVALTKENLTDGFPEEVKLASPIHYSNKRNLPYTMLLCGKYDLFVPYSNVSAMFNELQKTDRNKSQFFFFENSDHMLANDPYVEKAAKDALATAFFAYVYVI